MSLTRQGLAGSVMYVKWAYTHVEGCIDVLAIINRCKCGHDIRQRAHVRMSAEAELSALTVRCAWVGAMHRGRIHVGYETCK